MRAHKSFRNALTQAVMGALTDSGVAPRSAVEGVTRLSAVVDGAGFVEQFTDAHIFDQGKIARLTLNNPDYRTGYSFPSNRPDGSDHQTGRCDGGCWQ